MTRRNREARSKLISWLLLLIGMVLAGPSSRPTVARQNPPLRLNENCIVSVLNRNVRVKPDGSWVLPNIPANFGMVRARATCIFNGITVSGESAPFLISANGSINVPPIILGPTTPIPRALTLSAATNPLTQVGATSQITVMAAYADGSTTNVSAASTGTTYLSSNSALATVTADGLVRAVASGTVLIQATLEGTSGFTSVQVVLTSDSDGDGIPDDVELGLGLNPNSPADGLLDPDQDGLSNADEYRAGTPLNQPDADGDGILDGEEVRAGADGFVTNPLSADTDGDGVRDGLEVTSGSDPTSTGSVNLGQALQSVELTPSNFILTVNSIVGEASLQLTFTGHLKDGTTIDLTSTQKGTNYTSTDLNICNFGSPDGRVFAGSNGGCTITASNSGFTAQATGTVNSFTPTPLSFVSIPGFANAVAVNGNTAFVAAGSAGLQVVNVTNRNSPVIIGSLALPGNANDVKLVGNFAYVAAGTAGLHIVDVSSPTSPILRGTAGTGTTALGLVVTDGTAYLASTSRLVLIDVRNPLVPTPISNLTLTGTIWDVDVDPVRKLAMVAGGTAGLHVVDLAIPAALVRRGGVSTGDARGVAVGTGNYVFVADRNNSLASVDTATPTAPAIRSNTTLNLGGRLNEVALSGSFALGADVLFVNGVPITEISNPLALVSRAVLNFSNFRDDNGIGLAVDGSYVYLAGVAGSLDRGGTTGSSRLYIGQYMLQEDRLGVPPTVAITSPEDNASIIEGTNLPVRVTATDDVGVASVSFLVNGQVVFVDTSQPFEYTVTVPAAPSSLTLGARATDLGGNVGTAAPVTVNSIPDPLTTVVGRIVDSNAVPVAGATVTLGARTALSLADGTFSFFGVPTVAGDISVQASAVIGGKTVRGSSQPTHPVPSGTTNVGDIRVTAGPILQMTDFIADGSRSNFNGFEAMTGTLFNGTFFTGGNGPYTEGGVTVRQVNGDAGNDIWMTYFRPEGIKGWYPSGGDAGYTSITRVGGVDFENVGLLRSSGFGAASLGLYYELYDNGVLVLSGTVAHTNNGAGLYLGWSGGGFDEIRLRDSNSTTVNSLTGFGINALAIDAIELSSFGPAPGLASTLQIAPSQPGHPALAGIRNQFRFFGKGFDINAVLRLRRGQR